jgi:hypothetical protein
MEGKQMVKCAFIILAVGAALLAKPTYSAPASAPPNQSHYCMTGTMALMIDDKDEILQKIYETCKPGDIIGVAAGGNGSVAVQRLCDFTKTITPASRLSVCVLAPLRPTR